MRPLLCTLAFVFALSSPALARQGGGYTNSPQDLALRGFASKALDIPAALMNHGITQVGRLSLPRLVEQMRTVQWFWYEGGFSAPLDGSPRGTANCDRRNKSVTVNLSALPSLTPYAHPAIALHEALCALDYRVGNVGDNDYVLSLSLYLAIPEVSSRIGIDVLRAVEVPIFGADPSSKPPSDRLLYSSLLALAGGGGGTSVGGGGDAFALSAKLLALMLAPAWHSGVGRTTPDPVISKEDLFLKVLLTGFELIPVVTQPGQTALLSVTASGKPMAQVPLLLWASEDPMAKAAESKRLLEWLVDLK